MSSVTKLRIPWAMIGGREAGMASLQLAAQTRDWVAALNINAVDNRVVWMTDDETVTICFREAA